MASKNSRPASLSQGPNHRRRGLNSGEGSNIELSESILRQKDHCKTRQSLDEKYDTYYAEYDSKTLHLWCRQGAEDALKCVVSRLSGEACYDPHGFATRYSAGRKMRLRVARSVGYWAPED